jgi:hypothetical protein
VFGTTSTSINLSFTHQTILGNRWSLLLAAIRSQKFTGTTDEGTYRICAKEREAVRPSEENHQRVDTSCSIVARR